MNTRPFPQSSPSSFRRLLTPEEQHLAEQIHRRAERLRAGSEDGLSIRQAVELAAIQMGVA